MQHPEPSTPSEVGGWHPAREWEAGAGEGQERMQDALGSPPHPRRQGLKWLEPAPPLDCAQGIENHLGETPPPQSWRGLAAEGWPGQGGLPRRSRSCSLGSLSLCRERAQAPPDLLGKRQWGLGRLGAAAPPILWVWLLSGLLRLAYSRPGAACGSISKHFHIRQPRGSLPLAVTLGDFLSRA